MKTRFFFALPVVAMFACATVANAAVCKAEVNKVVGVELASVNNVDAGMDAKLATRLFPPYFGMNVDVKATSLTSGNKIDTKAESGFHTSLRKRMDAETSAEVALQGVRDQIGSGMTSLENKVDERLAKRTGSYDATLVANSIGIFGMNVNAKATSLTSGNKIDTKAESGFHTSLRKRMDAETSAEVALQGVRDQIGSGMTSLENKIGVEAGAKAMTVASRIFVLSSNMSGYTA